MSIILITGVSSGIGQACADYFHQQGNQVIGISRSILERPYETHILDITNHTQVIALCAQLISLKKMPDILIHAAGYSIFGPIELTNMEQVRQQFETNFFAMVNLVNHLLPEMRQLKKGKLIFLSSIAGMISLPYQAFYSATKFAMEGYAEALRNEVAQFGLHVSLVQPGDIKTSFTKNRQGHSDMYANTIYKNAIARCYQQYVYDETNAPSPSVVVKIIEKIINTASPKLRYKVGRADQIIGPFIKNILPSFIFEWAFRKIYKL